jgi:hypothetical protein
MNRLPIAVPVLLATLVVTASSHPATAAAFGATPLFTPRVPISAFGLPHWFDPASLHISTSVSMGTSGWGGGMNGLQVTTLSYSFKSPVAMSLSLGNAWGPTSLQGGQNFFLEGFNLAYQPSRSFLFQIQYQDLRSPLQFQPYGFRSASRWGYGTP